jgi:mannose-6-phosphate isomerase-like protein (cupin superfamily)
MEPHASHPLLKHARTTEFFVVLEGGARARIAGSSLDLRRGDYFILPPGSEHEFRAGRRGVTVLAVFCPALDLRDPDIVLVKDRRAFADEA